MNNKKAKQLRKLAKNMTVGKPISETKKVYNRLKTISKEVIK